MIVLGCSVGGGIVGGGVVCTTVLTFGFVAIASFSSDVLGRDCWQMEHESSSIVVGLRQAGLD